MSTQTTVCLLSYKRPEHVRRICAALREQEPAVAIWLWNNGPPVDVAADWTVSSSRNQMCLPRWYLAAQASTPYVVILDDDLLPAKPTAIADLVAHCDGRQVVGPIGALVASAYSEHREIRTPPTWAKVDVIKGRCLAMRSDVLRPAVAACGVLTARVTDAGYDDLAVAEDIAVCGAVACGKRRWHLVPGGLEGCFVDLHEGSEALSRRPDHMARRNRVFATWFGGPK